MNLDHVSNDQLEAALDAAVAKALENNSGSGMANYHVLSTQEDHDPLADADVAMIGGEDSDLFYNVPIDLSVLRAELTKLISVSPS